MPRKARAIYQGQYYHVITRGNNRQFLFQRPEDYEFTLSNWVAIGNGVGSALSTIVL